MFSTLITLEYGIVIIDLDILTFDLDIVHLYSQSILLDDQSSFSINQLLDHFEFSQIASPQLSPVLITGIQCWCISVLCHPSASLFLAPRLPVSHTWRDLMICRSPARVRSAYQVRHRQPCLHCGLLHLFQAAGRTSSLRSIDSPCGRTLMISSIALRPAKTCWTITAQSKTN